MVGMYPFSPYLRHWVLIRWLTAGLRFDLLGLHHDVSDYHVVTITKLARITLKDHTFCSREGSTVSLMLRYLELYG